MLTARRTFLGQALAAAGVLSLHPALALAQPLVAVPNVTQLYTVQVARVVAPATTQEVAQEVRAWPGKIAVGGGRYSMGGQVGITGGLHLDMRKMNKLLNLDTQAKVARVQAGIRWRDLQDVLDLADLSVRSMQSYSNFTAGGAVSVNAHGRYIDSGPVGSTVRALKIVIADGTVVEATPTLNTELFRAAIGGYGAVGVITEVELDLADNVRIERVVKSVALKDYPAHFARLADAGDHIFHNADLSPPHFNAPVSVSWRRTRKPLTETRRLVARGASYELEQNIIFLMTEAPLADLLIKSVAHPLRHAGAKVKWRNHEASLDVAELEPESRRYSTYVLQEYFIPVRHFEAYVKDMAATIRKFEAKVLNVSVRHAMADPIPLLPWAKEEVFSFVVYYKQGTGSAACEQTATWTRAMIDVALGYEGRYYLPYQLHATKAQFEQAYPEADAFRAVKRKADPTGKFSNELWVKYL
ncbi:FAD-binding oxidoreductase [Massilia cavernae]|uniref:FAD-binding oxidoreductase n=1 Tax=Massilia cavernae TaxID=2320864 RepID=A0A418XH32_9BURK|nr:FAD-binding oxidoreductase [Massilia cavernae]RJG11751.1 FAD-binding oxidoreductase [Massilia cavernae]